MIVLLESPYAGDGDENTGNPNMYHESRNCLECLNREVDAQTEKIQAQAAVIEKLLEALTKIATARIGKPERWAHALFSDEKIAVEALATPSDSTQILAEVRKQERERVEKMLLGELFDSTLRRNLISKIRAME